MKVFSWIVFILAIVIQFIFVPHYWNDKTSTAAMIVSSMERNKSYYAKDLSCYIHPDHNKTKQITWAEEPPIFHYLSLAFKKISGKYSLRILPLLCYFMIVLGIFKISLFLDNKRRASSPLLLIFLAFTPSLYIHALRFLPDVLAMAFMCGGTLCHFKNKYKWAWFLFVLGVTTKILAIVPLFFFCLFTLLHDKKNMNLKRFLILASYGIAVLPTFAWLYILQEKKILNPFFVETLSLTRHAGGSDFSILWSYKYWSKIWGWYFYRGIGVLSLFLILLNSLLLKRSKKIEEKILLWVCGSFIVNVCLFRGPQITAPWYSFYYQIFFLILAGTIFLGLGKKQKIILVLLQVAISFSFIKYERNVHFPSYEEAPFELPCEFQATVEKQKREKS